MGKSKVTDEMLKAGLHAYNQCDVDTKALEAAYLAMRAARPRKTRPVAAEKPVVDREAVARAMFEWKREHRPAYVFTWDELPEQVKDIYRNDADAAIAAMGAVALPEELPASVARAGLLAYENSLDNGTLEAMQEAWRAMLAAWREEAGR